MGTTFSVKAVLPEGERTGDAALAEAVDETLERVDALMSTWRPESELNELNRQAAGEPFPLSPETFAVLTLAQEVSRETDGAFDITVAPLVDAWGFGPASEPEEPLRPDVVAGLLDRIGYRRLQLQPADATATKERDDLRCDLSAIAKGYAVDLVAERLTASGIEEFMVEVGGEVRARGSRPGGGGWRIAIETPVVGRRETARIVALTDLAMATSGDYRNFWERDGVRYSHTIDPRTGYPVRHSLASVSVVHPRCAVADAWATALMVLGPEEGLRLAEAHGLAALLQVYEGNAARRITTSAFEALFPPGR